MTLSTILLCLVLCLTTSSGYPVEEPTKFYLNTGDLKIESTQAPTKLEQAQEFLSQIGDALRIGRGRLVNSITLARNNIIDRAESIAANNVISVINAKAEFTDQGRKSLESFQILPTASKIPNTETVHLESAAGQSLTEKTLQWPFTEFFARFFMPTPLVDRIREEEKYGNSGDKFMKIGVALVNSFESLSNFLNTVVAIPNNIKKSTAHNINDKLNQIGARLIGLQ